MHPGVSALRLVVWLAIAASAIARGSAHAAGFSIFEHSGRGLGSAFAGEVAGAEDSSTVFFNPAGMAALGGTRLDASTQAIIPSIEFSNRGSTLTPVVGGGPLRGTDGGNAGETGLVPAFHLTHELPHG